jgi:hypothetical protein
MEEISCRRWVAAQGSELSGLFHFRGGMVRLLLLFLFLITVTNISTSRGYVAGTGTSVSGINASGD